MLLDRFKVITLSRVNVVLRSQHEEEISSLKRSKRTNEVGELITERANEPIPQLYELAAALGLVHCRRLGKIRCRSQDIVKCAGRWYARGDVAAFL